MTPTDLKDAGISEAVHSLYDLTIRDLSKGRGWNQAYTAFQHIECGSGHYDDPRAHSVSGYIFIRHQKVFSSWVHTKEHVQRRIWGALKGINIDICRAPMYSGVRFVHIQL